MPWWEKGDLATLQAKARQNLRILTPFVDAGAVVAVVNPTCSLMLRREYPDLVERYGRLYAGKYPTKEYVNRLRTVIGALRDRYGLGASSR